MDAHLSRLGWLVAVVLALIIARGAYVVEAAARVPQGALEMEMTSSRAGTAELYFDGGRGFNENDAKRLLIGASDRFSVLRFGIPQGIYRQFRFDPLDGAGSFTIRNLRLLDPQGRAIHAFAPGEVQALHDIAAVKAESDHVSVTTIDPTDDPSLLLALEHPVTVGNPKSAPRRTATALGAGAMGFAASLLLWTLAIQLRLHVPVIRGLGRLAAWCGRADFLPFDRPAILFLAVVTAIFAGLAALGMHGSSISFMGRTIPHAVPSTTPWAGTAKQIRSDEWGYYTPAILYQLRRADPLSVNDTMLGPGPTALVADLPSRHFTVYFRPQFLAFLILPTDYAFAAYWQMKGWLFMVGSFLAFLLFFRSTWAAAAAALWLYFSHFSQWWYSTPCAMPEMIGLWGFTVTGACYLLVGRKAWVLLAAAALTAACAINFALCLYLPFLIPLSWLGAALVAAFGVAQRKAVWRRAERGMRIGALVLCLAIIGAVMAKFYVDARPAIAALAGTSYPGQRLWDGGQAQVGMMVSHLMNFWESEHHFPPPLMNICEASGFFWFAPVLIGIVLFRRRIPWAGLGRCSASAAGIVFCILLAWALVPIPARWGAFLFLNRVGFVGCFLTMGMANILLTMQYLFLAPPTTARVSDRPRALLRQGGLLAVLLALTMAMLVIMNIQMGRFWSLSALLPAAGLFSVLLFCVLTHRKMAFFVFLVVPLIYNNTLVNPLDRGFGAIDDTGLHALTANKSYRAGSWIIFSRNATAPGFFSANGYHVFNGCKYTPDLTAFAFLDPSRQYFAKYNQAAFFLAKALPVGATPWFDIPEVFTVEFGVSPADAGLRQMHIRYAAFDAQPDPAMVAAAGLKALAESPVDGFWLYEYAAEPPGAAKRNP